MPNIHVSTINASAPANVLVGTTSAAAIAENINRVGLVLTNVSSSTMYLGLAGNTAVLVSGITLTPNGGVWSMDEYSYNNEAINAISHTAGSVLAFQEFIR